MDTKTSSIMVLFILGFSIVISSYGQSKTMAETSVDSTAPAPSPAASVALYIVLTDDPPANMEAEAFYLRTLSPALGSEEAAKKALVYVYKHAITGFAAMLTPDQASTLEKQPEVEEVIPDQKSKLFLTHTLGFGTINLRT